MSLATLSLCAALLCVCAGLIFYLGLQTGRDSTPSEAQLRPPVSPLQSSTSRDASPGTSTPEDDPTAALPGTGTPSSATGEASRTPKTKPDASLPAQSTATAGRNAPDPSETALETQHREAIERTRRLLMQGQRELSIEEIPLRAQELPPLRPPPLDASPAPSLGTQPQRTPAPRTPPPRAAPSSSSSLLSSGPRYAVQAASYRQEERANALVDRLKQRGFSETYRVRFQDANGKVWYRVRIGEFPEERAQQIRTRLIDRGLVAAPRLIVVSP